MRFLRQFGRRRHVDSYPHAGGDPYAYRYRIVKRDRLLAKSDLTALPGDRADDEQQRLEQALEAMSLDGWKLVGVAGGEFIFRRRG